MSADKRFMDRYRFQNLSETAVTLTADQNKLRLMALDNPEIMMGKPARDDIRESIMDVRLERLLKGVK